MPKLSDLILLMRILMTNFVAGRIYYQNSRIEFIIKIQKKMNLLSKYIKKMNFQTKRPIYYFRNIISSTHN